MAEYQWKGAGYAPPLFNNIYEVLIDIPELIAGGADCGLALTSAPNTGVALPATGFADGDILEVFWVPKGTVVKAVGLYLIAAEGGAANIDVGLQSATETDAGTDIDFFHDAYDINAAAGTLTDSASAQGQCIFETNGSIDIEFNTDATAVAEFVIWAEIVPLDYSNFGF